MSAPKPPAPPDPVKTAEAQGAMNRETAISQYLLGATNQVTPFGSLTYTSLGSWGDALQGTGSPGLGSGYGSASSYGGQQPSQTPGQAPSQYLKNGNDDTPRLNPAYTQWEMDQRYALKNPTASAGAASTRGPTGGGSSSFTGAAYDVPRFQVTQTLTPDLQATVDNFLGTAKNLSGTLNNTLSQQFDPSGLPARAGNVTGGQGIQSSVNLRDVATDLGWKGPGVQYDIGADDWSEDRARVEEALLSRVNPSFDQDRQRMEASLIARGVRPGTVAYDRQMDQLNRSLTDARFQAVLAGGQEQSRLANLELAQGNFRNSAQAQGFGQNLTDKMFTREGIGINNNNTMQEATFRNTAQQQQFGQQLAAGQFNNANRAGALEEAMALRSLPLNEINALLSGTQIAGPKFGQTPQPGVAGVDYTGLVGQQYQGQMAAYNAQMQNRAGLLGGIAGIGSSLLGAFSDRRLKTDIKRVGTTDSGLGVYTYRYKSGGPVQMGVMADEVEKVMPEAVGERDGFKTVRYDMLAEAA